MPIRDAVARAAMVAVMLSALTLVVVDRPALDVAAAGALCLFLVLGWRQFGPGTWVPVLLSLLVATVALSRGLPVAVWLEAAGRMVFLAALMGVLNTLRTAASVAPEVAQAGRFLTRQPASRRYVALTMGGHLFGVLINFGGLVLLLDLATRSMKDDAADTLLPELREVRLRRMTLAVLRGFGMISLWSPFGFATNVVLITVPGISYAQFGPLGFAMSFVFVAIGWTLDRLDGRRYGRANLPQPRPPEGSWIGAVALVGHVVALGASVVALHEVSTLSFQQALIVLVPVYAVAWVAVATRSGPGGSVAGIGAALRATWVRQAGTANEVGVFASAGFLPVILMALLPMGSVQAGVAGLGLGAVPLALGLVVGIVICALLGVNPIVSASVLGAVASELAVPGLSVTAIALAITGGWSVVIGLSPVITTIVLSAAIVERPVWLVGPVWNWSYCAAILVVWCALLAGLMVSGAI